MRILACLAVLFLSLLLVSACTESTIKKGRPSTPSDDEDTSIEQEDATSSTDIDPAEFRDTADLSCLDDEGPECPAGTYCAAVDGASPSCISDNSTADGEWCMADFQCASFRCNLDNERCAASPGAACTLENGCGLDQENGDVSYVCTNGTCEPGSGDIGDACANFEDCQSSICKNNLCVSGNVGDSCDDEDHCASGFCVAKKCSAGEINNACNLPGDCKSRACKGDQCVAGNVGDACKEYSHCSSAFCVLDKCSNGHEGDVCVTNDDCIFGECEAKKCKGL